MGRATFYILAALAQRDLDGSRIRRQVLRLTGGALRLRPTTLHDTLDRMLESGWIVEDGSSNRVVGERFRRHSISESGKVRLEQGQKLRHRPGLVKKCQKGTPLSASASIVAGVMG